MTDEIVFILKGYPRLSETFIAQEIRALEQRGIKIRIVSLRFPTDKHVHPVHREIQAPVAYLPEYLYQEPLRVLRGWWKARRLPGYAAAFRQWIADLRRDRTSNRGRRFGQACVLAAELGAPNAYPKRLHAHFIHTPAAVAYYTHLMTGIPWSCSAHAKDIWLTPDWEKREKLASMDWLVTCTETGHRVLAGLAPTPQQVSLVYHGLDFTRFPEPPARPARRQGPFTLLSVGRLVPKKGYAGLIEALGKLPKDLDWRFRQIGGGPLKDALQAEAERLGIAARITWLGARPQETVLEEYRGADLFILNSRIAADGDRDGLPNVLMEAQSQRLPVIATNLAGIPELVIDGETGALVPPDDPTALGQAIARLLNDAALRQGMADAGFARVRSVFAMDRGIADLERRFKRGD
ncbi:glycosyltransferase [Dongia sedimenti]|uniref:Glycosyltransferase n=1 Tax=Dongia sedimenti TaxID=3064282 RepID=A0ABU0YL74_9PROT|nr:glycosyltransferase [Rhodospirillaceae bacterium R-7]